MNVPHPLRISRDPHGERGGKKGDKKMDDDDEKSLSGLLTED